MGQLLQLSLPVLVVMGIVVFILLLMALHDFIMWFLGPRPKRVQTVRVQTGKVPDFYPEKPRESHVEHLTYQRK